MITINFYFFKLGYKRDFLFIWSMTYTSNILNEYNAVLSHIDKMKKVYAEYGIYFKYEILINEQGYRVEAVEQKVELMN